MLGFNETIKSKQNTINNTEQNFPINNKIPFDISNKIL